LLCLLLKYVMVVRCVPKNSIVTNDKTFFVIYAEGEGGGAEKDASAAAEIGLGAVCISN
jgi:hypothetical protein